MIIDKVEMITTEEEKKQINLILDQQLKFFEECNNNGTPEKSDSNGSTGMAPEPGQV